MMSFGPPWEEMDFDSAGSSDGLELGMTSNVHLISS